MSSIAAKRIKKELAELMRSDEVAEKQVDIRPSEDDLMHLEGMVKGPPDTPYSGAEYHLEIVIPNNYPFVPPKVRMKLIYIQVNSYHRLNLLRKFGIQISVAPLESFVWMSSMTNVMMLQVAWLQADPAERSDSDWRRKFQAGLINRGNVLSSHSFPLSLFAQLNRQTACKLAISIPLTTELLNVESTIHVLVQVVTNKAHT